MLDLDPFSAFFGLYLYEEVVQSYNDLIVMGLEFIEDFIFLVKKIFLTKSQKLASERKFDINKIPSIGPPVFLSNKSA